MKLKVVSWNIAGGHTVASLDHFDYLPEDIEYFAEQLKKISADIICLQEVQTRKDLTGNSAQALAEKLGFNFVFNSPCSDSHIDLDSMLGNAVLSRNEFKKSTLKIYPNPDGDLFWADGKLAARHEKGLQVVDFENFQVANNQMLPVKLFGFNYDDNDRGKLLANRINQTMKMQISVPVIWCGDFNFGDPLKVYPFMQSLNLKDALPGVGTRPSKDGVKKKSDFIFYSPEFKVIDGGVMETNTDHYLCWAEFETSNL